MSLVAPSHDFKAMGYARLTAPQERCLLQHRSGQQAWRSGLKEQIYA